MSGEPLSECVICDRCPHPHLLNEDGARCVNPRPASPPPAATATPRCTARRNCPCPKCSPPPAATASAPLRAATTQAGAEIVRLRAEVARLTARVAELEAMPLQRPRPLACPRCGVKPWTTFEGACTACGEPHK